MVLVVPGSMSPVSPTLVPAVSSLMRSGSPSNVATGTSAAGVFVFRTTNSCGIVPSLVTVNVTDPDAGVPEGMTDHWFKLTETFLLASAEADPGEDDDPTAAVELEQAEAPRTTDARPSPVHLACPFISRSSLAQVVVTELPGRFRTASSSPGAERPSITAPSR